MKKMKKILALLLAMAMCISMLSLGAYADEDDTTDDETSEETEELDNTDESDESDETDDADDTDESDESDDTDDTGESDEITLVDGASFELLTDITVTDSEYNTDHNAFYLYSPSDPHDFDLMSGQLNAVIFVYPDTIPQSEEEALALLDSMGLLEIAESSPAYIIIPLPLEGDSYTEADLDVYYTSQIYLAGGKIISYTPPTGEYERCTYNNLQYIIAEGDGATFVNNVLSQHASRIAGILTFGGEMDEDLESGLALPAYLVNATDTAIAYYKSVNEVDSEPESGHYVNSSYTEKQVYVVEGTDSYDADIIADAWGDMLSRLTRAPMATDVVSNTMDMSEWVLMTWPNYDELGLTLKETSYTWGDDENEEKTYIEYDYIPESYTGEEAVALVVLLHGYSEDPLCPAATCGWADMAAEEGFILIAPDYINDLTASGVVIDCIMTAVEQALETYNIDESRIYLTGFSMGGMSTMLTGFANTDVFAAIAPMAGAADISSVAMDADEYDLPVFFLAGNADEKNYTTNDDGTGSFTVMSSVVWTQLLTYNGLTVGDPDYSINAYGYEADETYTETYQDIDYTFYDYYVDGYSSPIVELVEVDGVAHACSNVYASLAWDFLSNYARGEDGSVVELTSDDTISVGENETLTVEETTTTSKLILAEGASLAAPDGYSITITVDGVEMDVEAGNTYTGEIVINITEKISLSGHASSMADWAGSEYRAAIYLDDEGLQLASSAISAVSAYSYDEETGTLTVGTIQSVGTTFNGIIVNEGTYTIKDAVITFNGDGGNDFNGYGAAILITGEDTEVILDNVTVDSTGLVRGTLATANSASVLVMNSTLTAHEGVLPDDYVQNVENVTGLMKAAPWTLGITGTNRATNLLGNATSTYFNSYISSDGWGVLSGDDAEAPSMYVVNSTVYSNGERVYGLFGIGSGSEIKILGSTVDVTGMAINLTAGTLLVGSAAAENMEGVYGADIIMADENYDATVNTVLKSDTEVLRIGGGAVAEIQSGTVMESGGTTILSKGGSSTLTLDGVTISSESGIILQLMDSDDAGADFTDSTCPLNTSYTEDTETPVYVEGTDLTATGMDAAFSNMTIVGNFYNSTESYTTEDALGVSTSAVNLNLTFSNTSVEGVISSTLAQHVDPETGEIITTIDDYTEVGSIINTVRPVINNGVNVTLTNGSTWAVTGTSYLSSLTIDDTSSILAADGSQVVVLLVDGVVTELAAGTYTGAITVTVVDFVFADDDGTGAWEWASDAIYEIYEAGIISGFEDNTYRPDNSLTRAQAAKIIAEAYGLELTDAEYEKFADDDGSGNWTWASEYIYACVQAGILNGYTDGTFLPDQAVTRAEIAKMIAIAEGISSDAVTSSFSDVGDDHWALTYIEACYENGLVQGIGSDVYGVSNDITRAQMAVLISRIIAD